jgi:hypothetical protein
MTRLGKIARLPREIREELNVRLQNGEVGRKLVEWLNGLPAAQAVLAANFGGRAISMQNLSEWKQEPKGRARSRGGKAVIRVRQRQNNKRDARFAGCPTLPGRQEGGLSDAAQGEQTKSNRIKPNQTQSNQIKPRTCRGRELACRWRMRTAEYRLVKPSQTSQAQSNQSSPVKPVKPSQTSQTQSNPVKPEKEV